MTDKIQIVCSTCGTTNVTRDAVVRWDDEAQDWSVANVFDNADCDVCSGETSLEEIPHTEWREALGREHELNGFKFVALEGFEETTAYVFDDAGAVVWKSTKDQWGHPFGDSQEALDGAREEIIRRTR